MPFVDDAGPHGCSHSLVSVIVPALGVDRLRSCLAALEAQTYPREHYEIILVDNGNEGLQAQLEADFPAVIFLREKERSSYAARNRGIASARGDIVAFTDADCVPDPEWIAAGVRELEHSPRCGLVAGDIQLVARNPGLPNVSELHELIFAFRQQHYANVEHFGSTSNVFTWRRVIDDVGPFDATVRSGGDREWGNRVHRAGYEIVYSAAAIIAHPTRGSLRALFARSARIAGGEHDFWRRRRHPWLRAMRVLPRYLLPMDRLRPVLRDPRLGSFGTRLRVGGVVIVISYVKLLERLRILLGGEKRR